jgi:hypothetical protein
MALWFGLGAGPVAWAALLEINYVLSYVACEQRQSWMLHLGTAGALVITAAGALAAWFAAPALHGPPGSTAEARARFMAVGGLALCAWFALVILATAIPVLFLDPCTP